MRASAVRVVMISAIVVFAPLCTTAFARAPEPVAPASDLARLRADAEAGHRESQYELGRRYYLGDGGVRQDFALAGVWIGKAAQAGQPMAQYVLGTMLYGGKGLARDQRRAMEWFRKAAELGIVGAQSALGRMYREGDVAPADYAAALKWLGRAAEAGEASAQYELGRMYAAGSGTTPDIVEAHKWINIATSRIAAEYQKDYARARDHLALSMTSEQITEAQRRARAWMDGFERKAAGGVSGGVPAGLVGGVVGGLPEPPSAPPPIRVGGEVKEPKRLKHVTPAYPDIAKQARVQGVVILEVVIGPDGKVQQAEVLRGIPLLDEAAIDAVKQWEYSPTLLNGVPVPVIMTITVSFTLS